MAELCARWPGWPGRSPARGRPLSASDARSNTPGHFAVYYVSTNGGIRFRSRWVSLSHVLAEEYVGLEEIDDAVWNVYDRNRLPRAGPNV